uniref:RNA helicase n=1 Tax=Globisporangium ultimum (strain ATCC 200006 / CBS 805.95 / DAOM BR144) TaxID=431595 RepID=K3WUP4_GLOUD
MDHAGRSTRGEATDATATTVDMEEAKAVVVPPVEAVEEVAAEAILALVVEAVAGEDVVATVVVEEGATVETTMARPTDPMKATMARALVEDGSRNEMSFPADLDNTQRRYIHSLVKKFGLFSKSSGKGDARFIHVAKVKKNAKMEQISLLLDPMPMNPSTCEWVPEPVADYLVKFPFSSDGGDEWSNVPSRAMASYAQQSHHRTVGRPLFRPLQPDAPRKPAQPRPAPLPAATSLPVYSYRDQILEYVASNQVTVISGDTGCGKSTQIPQFLLDDAIANGTIDQTRIICTQPRRLSAISLAERVARERSTNATTGVNGSGTPDSLEVGHAIRFDSSFDTQKSKLIFCTTGTLLKWLNNDPLAHGFSHLILDEVHERDQFTDYLLILLKTSILKQRKDLKVILMSATIQVEKFAQYFAEYNAPMLEMTGGRCYPVTTLFLEDALALLNKDVTDFSMDGYTGAIEDGGDASDEDADSGLMCPMCNGTGFADEEAFGMHVAVCFGEVQHEPPMKKKKSKSEGKSSLSMKKKSKTPSSSNEPSTSHQEALEAALRSISLEEKDALLASYVKQEDALMRDQAVDYDILLRLLDLIDRRFPLAPNDAKGAVLVFLPGWEEISYMERALLHSHHGPSVYEIALLHSRLSAQEQRRAFMKPPRGKRKLILATNIAETSLTIEDVVFVIDCGKSKQAHALATTSSASFVMGLQTTWISKANCVQRTGRAGRVRPGVCFRLFSRARYETAMKDFMVPELLTTPLEELLLQIKLLQFENKLHIRDAKQFLMEAMDPPSETAIDASLQRLCDMGALGSSAKDRGSLTLLGWHLGHICNIGVSVQLGKLILWGHFLGSFTMVLETTCALSGYRDPFVNFLGMSADDLRRVEHSKRNFSNTMTSIAIESDHFVLMQALQAYANFPSRSFHDLENFCRKHMLHRQTIDQIFSIYRQSEKDMDELGMNYDTQLFMTSTTEEQLATYLMALSAGMYPNALFLQASSESRNWSSKEKVRVKMDSTSVLSSSSKPLRNAKRNPGTGGADEDAQFEWTVYHEMMQSQRMRVAKYGTKLPSMLLLLLLMGKNEQCSIEERVVPPSDEAEDEDEPQEPESRWLLVVDDWIVFELLTADEAYAMKALRERIHAAFHRHLVRLHTSHQEAYQQQQQQQHKKHRRHLPSQNAHTDELSDDLKRHDQELLQSIVAWITLDLQRSS